MLGLRCSETTSLVKFIITPLLANIWCQCLLPHCMGYAFCMDTLILVSFFVQSCSSPFQKWWGLSICHLSFGACSSFHSHLYHEHFLKQISYFFMGWDIHGERLCVTLLPVILIHKGKPHPFLFKVTACRVFVFPLPPSAAYTPIFCL